MTHDEIIKVINHHVKGGEIEYRVKGLSTWQAAATPNWDFSRYDFRAKPEPLVIYADFNEDGMVMASNTEQYQPPFGRKLRKFVEVTSALVDALAEVLSHHALACVSGLNLHDKPWLFDVDANDSPLITLESCKCSTNSKYLRAILPVNHPKGFSQNTPAQDN